MVTPLEAIDELKKDRDGLEKNQCLEGHTPDLLIKRVVSCIFLLKSQYETIHQFRNFARLISMDKSRCLGLGLDQGELCKVQQLLTSALMHHAQFKWRTARMPGGGGHNKRQQSIID